MPYNVLITTHYSTSHGASVHTIVVPYNSVVDARAALKAVNESRSNNPVLTRQALALWDDK